MKNQYKYTLLKANGLKEFVGIFDREIPFNGDKDEDGLYQLLNCNMIEAIPQGYWPHQYKGAEVLWGDEDGRFTGKLRNPHMKVLTDENGREWDCVGDIMVVERV